VGFSRICGCAFSLLPSSQLRRLWAFSLTAFRSLPFSACLSHALLLAWRAFLCFYAFLRCLFSYQTAYTCFSRSRGESGAGTGGWRFVLFSCIMASRARCAPANVVATLLRNGLLYLPFLTSTCVRDARRWRRCADGMPYLLYGGGMAAQPSLPFALRFACGMRRRGNTAAERRGTAPCR